jgi:eukaryotic-like serine/threonine-protein kinase
VVNDDLLSEGAVIGDRYVIESRLAEGGFGEIFRAYDRVANTTVAIKTVLPDALDRDDVTTRLLREARLAQTLQHPNTVDILDVGTLPDGKRPYVVMELLRGAPLSAWLHGRHTLSPQALVALLRDVLGSLAEAHHKGIVHRDVKPDNLFACSDGRIKVLDFGMSLAVAGDWGETTGEQLTKTGWIGGTVDYMAPEFFGETAHIGPTVDVYAVGCVAYRALAGAAPFHGGTMTAVAMRHIQQQVPPLPDSTPPGLVACIMGALEKNPHRRFPDAGSMLASVPVMDEARPWTHVELSGVSASVPEGPTTFSAQPGAPPPRIVPPPPEPSPSNTGLVLGIVVALILAGMGLFVLIVFAIVLVVR